MHTPQVDVLALGAHPDDVELGAGGTLLRLKHLGYTTAVVDFTQGELGTRGTPELRLKEAEDAGRILGLSHRQNLNLPDGFFQPDQASVLKLVAAIRAYRPRLLIANAPDDRHPDHGRAATLAREAWFLSGLRKVVTHSPEGKPHEPWRPGKLIHYIQDRYFQPQFVIDITDWMDQKLLAVQAYRSQFYDPASTEPITHIATAHYLEMIRGRASHLGNVISARYAEGFLSADPLRVDDPLQLVVASP